MFGKSKQQSQSELYDQHQKEADRQLKITAEQQVEAEKQFEASKQHQNQVKQQLERGETLQDKAEEQFARGNELIGLQIVNSNRQAKLLDAQEKLLERLSLFLDRMDRTNGN